MSKSIYDKSDKGVTNLLDVYHLIKKELGNIGKKMFKVPYAEITNEGVADHLNVTMQNIEDSKSSPKTFPHSQHFISRPTQYEMVPIFNYGKQDFYGHPLPIHRSGKNHAKNRLINTDYFSMDATIKPLQIAPGDVVVQGRQNNAMTFGKRQFKSNPTIRIGNDMFGRSTKKGFMTEAEILRAADDINYPIFYNPNVDGSSIHMLNGANPGIQLDVEVDLSTKRVHKQFYERSLQYTFQTERNDSENKVVIASDHLIFYTKGLDDPIGHDINMLASGNVYINSFRNIILATPTREEDNETEIGTIRIGNGEEPTGLPLSTMQPVVKGVDFQEAMKEVVSIFNFIRSQFKSLANGGIGVDRRGVGHAYSLKGAPIKILERKIETLEKRLSETLSDKVFTE